MGCQAVLRYMLDAAKEKDEKAGNMNLNLLPGHVVTVAMILFRY
jgi:hypothetical protein